ncbi:MAG: hypothetical protein WBL20_17145 [Sphingobium sp.]|uniref:hypothetical protein n=1 Tax=Sphingobium sp. TaxID=1912891 RepID=UPI003BB1B06A
MRGETTVTSITKTIDALTTAFQQLGSVELSDTAFADLSTLTGRPQRDIEALHRIGKLSNWNGRLLWFGARPIDA